MIRVCIEVALDVKYSFAPAYCRNWNIRNHRLEVVGHLKAVAYLLISFLEFVSSNN